jgi:hypothetical protein
LSFALENFLESYDMMDWYRGIGTRVRLRAHLCRDGVSGISNGIARGKCEAPPKKIIESVGNTIALEMRNEIQLIFINEYGSGTGGISRDVARQERPLERAERGLEWLGVQPECELAG